MKTKVDLFGTNWTKVSFTYYAPDEVITIVQNGVLIQWLLLLFVLWKVSHLRYPYVKCLLVKYLIVKSVTTTSITAGLVLSFVSGIFVLSFLFYQWTFIILLLVVELYHLLEEFGI